MTIHLLMRRPDGAPVVPSAATDVSRPRATPAPGWRRRHLFDAGGDPNDLRAQRWGVVVAEGEGARADGIAPLMEHRAREQGAAPLVIEVPRDLAPGGVGRWWSERLSDVATRDQPRFLLILGDLDEVDLCVQQDLADDDMFVGRLAFDDPALYGTYAEKLVAAETAGERRGASLFCGADDWVCWELVRSCMERAQVAQAAGLLTLAPVELLATGWQSLKERWRGPGSILMTVSHGLGPPVGGWGHAADQRALQGTPVLADGALLGAADVEEQECLPGGAWFAIGCFTAATPATSVYRGWSAALGLVAGQADAGRPCDGRGFVAALPKAALASPKGPLAFFGHADLAFACSWERDGRPAYHDRFYGVVETLARGRRAGVALQGIRRLEQQLQSEVLQLLRAAQDPLLARAVRPDPVRLAYLELVQEDMRAYVLLGDPAARIASGA